MAIDVSAHANAKIHNVFSFLKKTQVQTAAIDVIAHVYQVNMTTHIIFLFFNATCDMYVKGVHVKHVDE